MIVTDCIGSSCFVASKIRDSFVIGQEIQEEEIHVERVIPIYGVFL